MLQIERNPLSPPLGSKYFAPFSSPSFIGSVFLMIVGIPRFFLVVVRTS
jgi:hypothetical protein